MSTESNVFSQGGGGTHFEFEAQTAFMVMMLIGTFMPGSEEERIIRLRQQSGSLGYATDDVLVWSKDKVGQERRTLAQIKHGMSITKSNEEWTKVLIAAWKDFNDPALFEKEKDRIIVIVDNLSTKERKHLKELISWAKSKSSQEDFLNEVTRIKAKKEYYELFATILKDAGFNPSVKEMFSFFKCFDVWEFDFGTSASVCYNNFINLIELAKAPVPHLLAVEIWNKLFTAISGSDFRGGSIELATIPADLTELFSRSYFPSIQKQLLAISDDSKEILELIHDKIGGLTIDRSQSVESAIEELGKNQFLIISGEPGSGKSAIAKHIIEKQPGCLISLRADELNEGNLIDLLKNKGINLTVNAFFNHFPLQASYIIYVDALEKLLEGEGKPFQQLLKLLKKHPDIKLIASCRDANFHLLEIKYFSEQKFFKVGVGFLSDEELTGLAEQLPELKPLLENKRLSSLIRVPKYLDFAYKAIKISGKDFSTVNEAEFINDLWDIIVENQLNELTGGFAQKRREVFIKIAVDRAKRMIPFVAATNCDAETLEKLEKDNVIIRSRQITYAPAHDVLEDWALIRYVDDCFRQNPSSENFLRSLGTEPAMRRGFRLWVKNALSESNPTKIAFFSANLSNLATDRFWQDESLIALLYSDYCETFFKENESLLTADNFALFFRIIHILRTACRENSMNTWAERNYIPVGPGWGMVIGFIDKFKNKLPEHKYSLLILTLEDYAKLLLSPVSDKVLLSAAGQVSLFLLSYYKSKVQYCYDNPIVLRCVKLVFDFCGGIKDDILELFRIAVEMDDKDDRSGNWIEIRYYQKLISLALGGLTVGMLAKEYPDLLIELANKRWYHVEKEREWSRDMFPHSPDHDEKISLQFGLEKEENSYSTPSAQKTFVLSLLRNHPEKALDFIIGFINNTTDKFLESTGLKNEIKTKITIELPDGSSKIVRGIPNFWMSYRGNSSGVPKLIESVLMAVERYLIELGNTGINVQPQFQAYIRKLFLQSNSLFVTALLSSVCQAHPPLAGEWLMPLFTNKDFFEWDVSRFTSDMVLNSFGGPDDEYYRERRDADNMKHRQQYMPGLRSFITAPVLYSEGMAEKIFAIIDRFRAGVKEQEYHWRRILDDMDLRTYRLKQVIEQEDGKQVGLVQPEYAPDVAQKLEESKNDMPFDIQDTIDNDWMNKVFEGTENIEIDRWKQVYGRYINLPDFVWHEHRPGLLASLAIQYLWDDLAPEEKNWSVAMILKGCMDILIEKSYGSGTNVFDGKPLLTSLPLLSLKVGDEVDEKKIERLFFDLLLKNSYNDPRYGSFLNSISNHLWKTDPAKAAKWWQILVAYSSFAAEDTHGYNGYEKEQEEFQHKLDELFEGIYNGGEETNIEGINASEFDMRVLAKAIKIVPAENTPEGQIAFIKKMIDIYTEYMDSENRLNRRSENEGLELDVKFALTEKVPQIIFRNPETIGKQLLDYVLEKTTVEDFIQKIMYRHDNSPEFFRGVIENIIILADQSVPTKDKELAFANFNLVWKQIDTFLTSRGSYIFSNLLLLDTKWNGGTRDWEPIKNMKAFFEGMIEKYGFFQPAALINLLTHPGNTILMPKGISSLVSFLKRPEVTPSLMSIPFSEKLMFRIYEHHLDDLKADKSLLEDYLWMLDQLISQGSSDAYWIREFLISFRSKVVA